MDKKSPNRNSCSDESGVRVKKKNDLGITQNELRSNLLTKLQIIGYCISISDQIYMLVSQEPFQTSLSRN